LRRWRKKFILLPSLSPSSLFLSLLFFPPFIMRKRLEVRSSAVTLSFFSPPSSLFFLSFPQLSERIGRCAQYDHGQNMAPALPPSHSRSLPLFPPLLSFFPSRETQNGAGEPGRSNMEENTPSCSSCTPSLSFFLSFFFPAQIEGGKAEQLVMVPSTNPNSWPSVSRILPLLPSLLLRPPFFPPGTRTCLRSSANTLRRFAFRPLPLFLLPSFFPKMEKDTRAIDLLPLFFFLFFPSFSLFRYTKRDMTPRGVHTGQLPFVFFPSSFPFFSLPFSKFKESGSVKFRMEMAAAGTSFSLLLSGE